ncbi:hypothetical protein KO494_02940 [Lacinutrix sp. C3R15]|uniref:hypothetical protein n=1 Tax=Flavobacteriaceae TaxID=49546 RepID=UPI001C07EF05|nr:MULTISPECIES: hypothetical protein [Flavobacteriaceae]MBU2938486.1 hypothetical protein [Lacinutrix sp. C3R15]MDO6621800.1 hypothetical protein [Oceanihabitans sp. 1_MG-2023]
MKTKIKIILFFIFFLTNINILNAQESDYITDITAFIKKLNSELKSIFKDENKDRIIREINYLQNDLTAYLNARRVFMNYMKLKDYEIVNDQEARMHIQILELRLRSLLSRSRELSLIFNKDRSDIFLVIEYQEQQGGFLFDLTGHVEGYDNDSMTKDEIKNDALAIYDKLLQGLSALDDLKIKLIDD